MEFLPNAGTAGALGDCVLGIDPGTLRIGYGAVRRSGRAFEFAAAGTLVVERNTPLPARLSQLQAALEDLLDQLAPHTVVIERAFVGRNVHTALRLGEGRGIALACAARRQRNVVELAPAAVKRQLCGNGAATKEQVAYMVGVRLGIALRGGPMDATDALALALAHLFEQDVAALRPPALAALEATRPRR